MTPIIIIEGPVSMELIIVPQPAPHWVVGVRRRPRPRIHPVVVELERRELALLILAE